MGIRWCGFSLDKDEKKSDDTETTVEYISTSAATPEKEEGGKGLREPESAACASRTTTRIKRSVYQRKEMCMLFPRKFRRLSRGLHDGNGSVRDRLVP